MMVASTTLGGGIALISWTKLPFVARTQEEFGQKLPEWLGHIFYDVLPDKGFEVREEQIYTAFQMAKALAKGETLLAEAGPGTGKTFAYLLPAICYARMTGAPVVVASASGVLQRQLASPEGDVQTLSRILDLDIDARLAADPAEFLCEMKVRNADLTLPDYDTDELVELRRWAETTDTGARTEVPHVTDELWEHLAWDPGLPCDTCPLRGHCHVMSARRHYREAPDLVICDHHLFSRDLLTRNERRESGLIPFLPAYSAVVLDEGQHMSETWQRAQGFSITPKRLYATFGKLQNLIDRDDPVRAMHEAYRLSLRFFEGLAAATEPGEGKRSIRLDERLIATGEQLRDAVESLQDELVPEEAMNEGLPIEIDLQAYQARFDDLRAALRLLRTDQAVAWVEEDELWVVPRQPKGLFAPDHLLPAVPVIFSSATLQPEYEARTLRLPKYTSAKVGVPFDLGEQTLIYQPDVQPDPIAQTARLIEAVRGRSLVLLRSLAEVQRYRKAFAAMEIEYPVLWEGEGERGAQLERFRQEVNSVLVGATFWEGVDVPGEALSCCIIPALPFPAHDPLIRERREQAEAAGDDPDLAVDVPEMLIKLKQGAGRLIRTAADRGVLALLDRSYLDQPWAEAVAAAFPEDAERTDDLHRVADFLGKA